MKSRGLPLQRMCKSPEPNPAAVRRTQSGLKVLPLRHARPPYRPVCDEGDVSAIVDHAESTAPDSCMASMPAHAIAPATAAMGPTPAFRAAVPHSRDDQFVRNPECQGSRADWKKRSRQYMPQAPAVLQSCLPARHDVDPVVCQDRCDGLAEPETHRVS